MTRGATSPTTDDKRFKKAEQTITGSTVTDHNINDEYLKKAPNNIAPGNAQPSERGAWKSEEQEPREVGEAGWDASEGRMKPLDVENRILEDRDV